MPICSVMKRLLFVMALVGCSGSDDPCGEPAYGGDATDEAWRTMVDGEARVMTGHAEAPTIVEPTGGQTISAGAGPMLISWTSPIAKVPHLPPVTSDVYLVHITVPGRECPIALLTTEEEWRLDASSWDLMRSAGGNLSIEITAAYLAENRITEGPYRPAAPTTFTIGP